jgi:hypothetical protein
MGIGLALTTLGPEARGQGKIIKEKGPGDKEGLEGETLNINDELTRGLPFYQDKPGRYFKRYSYPMVAGVTYTIDLMRRGAEEVGGLHDPYLFLEDPTGAIVAEDDDSGGNLNARIIYRALATGTFKIVATDLRPNMIGRYTLVARPSHVPMPANQTMYGDITIAVETPLVSSLRSGGYIELDHGYIDYRFTIHNRSETESHEVTLKLPKSDNRYWSGPYLRAITRTVKVDKGQKVTISMFQPDLSLSNQGAEVAIDGRVQEDGGGLPVMIAQNRGRQLGMGRYGGGGPVMGPQILTGFGLGMPLSMNSGKMMIGPPATLLGKGGGGGHAIHESQLPLDKWSVNWLGYSGWDGIVVGAPELDRAPDKVRDALWRYVENGGSVLVVGKPKPPPKEWDHRMAEEAGLICYYRGFGDWLVNPEVDVQKWSNRTWQRIGQSWGNSGLPLKAMQSVSDAHRSFPVVDDVSIPVRGLFVVMLLFAIVLGPVNIHLLTRQKRRIWMLWTVPAISFVTCLLVLAYMLVSEGWQGNVRAEGLTVLDENNLQASTIGWVGYYTPVAPGDGLHFSEETELAPQIGLDRYSYRRQVSPRTLDWSNGQNLRSGWVTARIPAHFKLRSSQSQRRERVSLQREKDGSLIAVNHLGADIKQLWIADERGTVYGASNIPKEGKALLTAQGKATGSLIGLRDIYTQDWLRAYDRLMKNPNDYLMPGSYLAALDSTPFIEEGLPGARHRNSRSVVFGIMKEGGDES